MTQQTKPTAGALRAANALAGLATNTSANIHSVALIIDREMAQTGVQAFAELLQAAKDALQYVRGMQKDATEDHYFKLADNAGASASMLEQAIAKAERNE